MHENKMGIMKMSKLLWVMGLPMILSMILQAIYNVVDTVFVVNREGLGQIANQALTFAFPVQIFMIAIGVGTGVGINAMLSKSLGEGNKEVANKVCGSGIALGIIITLVFVLFGLFGANPYMQFMARNVDESLYDKSTIVSLGSEYLSVCCVYSIGSVGFAIFERFLQATGKTMYSTIGQISGALLNILLDYVFIYPCNMGTFGAALATILGQILSLSVAMFFHYFFNKEIDGQPKYIKPDFRIIRQIYTIGLPAMLMQIMLAVMMFLCIEIIGTQKEVGTLLQGAFGIYYKIMQIALFTCFGLSNTLISIVSYNHGMGDEKRVRKAILFGILDSVIVAAVLTLLFQLLATPISRLFGMTISDGGKEVIQICVSAMHIATIGYVFMGVSVAIQGILQGFRSVFLPLIISLLRLIVFVVPFSFLFLNIGDPLSAFWWTFPISEFLTAICSLFFLLWKVKALKKRQVQKENQD